MNAYDELPLKLRVMIANSPAPINPLGVQKHYMINGLDAAIEAIRETEERFILAGNMIND